MHLHSSVLTKLLNTSLPLPMQRPVMMFLSPLYGIQMPPAPWQALQGASLGPLDGQMAAAEREEEIKGQFVWADGTRSH